ncbi:MAG: ATP-binding protein [Actinomycetes bacterium]
MRPGSPDSPCLRDGNLLLTIGLPALLVSVPTARGFAAHACEEFGVSTDSTERVELVVSELSANAVKHAGGAFHLALIKTSAGVLVEVEDPLTCAPPVASRPDADAETGRGLQVVEQLSDDWGCEALPDGKRMWAQVRDQPLVTTT